MAKIKVGGLIASLVLLILTWSAGAKNAKFKGLSKTFMWSGIGLIPNYLVFKFSPNLIISTLERDPQNKAYAPLLKPILTTLFNAIGYRFLLVAAGLLVIATACLAAYLFYEKPKGRGTEPKPPKKTKVRDEGGMVANSL